MLDVALEVPLGSLALRRRGERLHPANSWVEALRDPLDRPALPRSVTAFEDDDDFETLRLDPLLKLHELYLKFPQSLVVFRLVQLSLLGCSRVVPKGGQSVLLYRVLLLLLSHRVLAPITLA